MRICLFRRAAVLVSTLGILLAPVAARADNPLPIIDLQPVATFAGAGDARSVPGNALVNGAVNLGGTVTIPIFKGFSASYDRIINGVFHNNFNRVNLPPLTAPRVSVLGAGPYQPGAYNDVVQQYRIDEQIKSFTLEAGLSSRQRVCCPGSADPHGQPSTEWHQGYFGVTYVTHPIDILHNSVFVLNVTGHTAAHNPSLEDLAIEQLLSPGVVDVRKREYGTTQAATFVLPVNHGLSTTATYTWGSFDYFENYPYPLNYGIWVFTANKRFTKFFGLELREANLWQRPNQNTPFLSDAIHVVDWSLIANFHIDTNHL